MKNIRVAVAQIASSEDKEKNLSVMKDLIDVGKNGGAEIICFPEMSLYRGGWSGNLESGETQDETSVVKIRKMACDTQMFILFSFFEKKLNVEKVFNTSLLIDPEGKIVASYRKTHLFDVILPGGKFISESESVLPGKKLGIAEILGLKVGIIICYDLRFPELIRQLALKGAKIVFVPSDFTAETGRDHWEVLLRARAIENQIFIVAPNQMGKNPVLKVASYGRSMVVDPWGVVVSKMPDEGGVMFADLNLDSQKHLRKRFPVLDHIRKDLI